MFDKQKILERKYFYMMPGVNKQIRNKKNLDNLFIDNFNRYIEKISSSEELEKLLDDKNLLKKENTISLLIKQFCKFNNLNLALKYLNILIINNFKIKLRSYTPIIDLLYRTNDVENLILIYENTRKNNIKISDIDFSKILYILLINKSNYINNFLEEMSEYLVGISKDSYKILSDYLIISPEIKLDMVDLSINIKENILDYIRVKYFKNNKCIKKLNACLLSLSEKKNVVVLDGANIGFYNNRPDKGNLISFFQIKEVIKYYKNLDYNVLVILHNRHCRYNSISENSRIIFDEIKNDIFQTPNSENDDLYWIYSIIYLSMYTNTRLVTNDKIRDHILNIFETQSNKFNKTLLVNFMNNIIINYDFNNFQYFNPININNYYIQKQKSEERLYWILPIIMNLNYVYLSKLYI